MKKVHLNPAAKIILAVLFAVLALSCSNQLHEAPTAVGNYGPISSLEFFWGIAQWGFLLLAILTTVWTIPEDFLKGGPDR